MQQNLQNGIKELMQKDMDRKDFLKYVGIGFVTLTGVAAAIKTVSQLNISKQARNLGYGASTYGGVATALSRKQQGK